MSNIKSQKKERESNYSIGTVVTQLPGTLIAEQFRTIRTNLQFSMVDKSIKSFIVTSANPGAGKSTIAANLSAVLATKNKRVLLVDADLRRPTVHRIYGLQNYRGLTSLLTDEQANAEDFIHFDNPSGLYILTSGAIPHNPADLLGSNRMKSIIKDLTNKFDVVVFDMPPVLSVADTNILASEVDGVLFIIPYGQVNKEDALKSKTALEKVNAKVIGTVINRTKSKLKNEIYY